MSSRDARPVGVGLSLRSGGCESQSEEEEEERQVTEGNRPNSGTDQVNSSGRPARIPAAAISETERVWSTAESSAPTIHRDRRGYEPTWSVTGHFPQTVEAALTQ